MASASIGSATGQAKDAPLRASFVGSGAEYFRIWIVNLLLTLVTLGIYSAWAKVRREQYFHGNTRLADASFGYHARPIAILRGRLIALGALVAIQASQFASVYLYFALIVGLVVGTPWVIVQVLRFRLHNTSWRGIRFRFLGTLRGAVKVFLVLALLGPLTLGLAVPFVFQRQARFRVDNSAFGGARFAFGAPVGRFYAVFAGVVMIFGAVFVMGAVPLGLSVQASGWSPQPGAAPPPRLIFGLIACYVAAILVAAPFAQVWFQNLFWNHVRLGPHRFACDQRVFPFLWLHVVNLLGMLATLGLFRPFAVVRVARYRAEHLSLIPGGSLEAFVADAEAAATATGEEFADFFDLDIGF